MERQGVGMDSGQLNMDIKGKKPAAAGRKGISGSTVKIIAVAAMLIDHIAAVVLMRQILAAGYLEAARSESMAEEWFQANGALFGVYLLMRLIGRLGFPIFCFLLVEGFQKTGNVKKYAQRLLAFAIISEIPFDLATKGTVFFSGYQNVYFTLLFGLLALCCIDWLDKRELPKGARILFDIAGVLSPGLYLMALTAGTLGGDLGSLLLMGLRGALVTGMALLLYRQAKGGRQAQLLCEKLTALVFWMCIAEICGTDYAGMGVLAIGVMYFYRERRVISALAGCIVLTIMDLSEITAFFVLIPIALYNGSRGLKMKYFFYAFYPVHLLLLYLISVWMGLGRVAML